MSQTSSPSVATPPMPNMGPPLYDEVNGQVSYTNAKVAHELQIRRVLTTQHQNMTKESLKKMVRPLTDKFPQQYCDGRHVQGLPRYFECHAHWESQDDCPSKQEWGPIQEFARSVISHYFGGNKGCWQDLPLSAVFHFCRKDYQAITHKYRNNPKGYALYTISIIRQQILLFDKWSPNNSYTIQLLDALNQKVLHYAERRLNKKLGDVEAAAQIDAEYKVKYTPTRHTKRPSTAKLPPVAATPVVFAHQLKSTYCSSQLKTSAEVLAVLDDILEALENGMITVIPPIEFLLQFPAGKEKRVKPGRRATKNEGEDDDDDDDDDDRTDHPINLGSEAQDMQPLSASRKRKRKASPAPDRPSKRTTTVADTSDSEYINEKADILLAAAEEPRATFKLLGPKPPVSEKPSLIVKLPVTFK